MLNLIPNTKLLSRIKITLRTILREMEFVIDFIVQI